MRERLFLHKEPPHLRPYPPDEAMSGPRSLHIINSTITQPFRNFGKTWTDKSRWRAEIRARGFEEVGNERQEFDPKPMPEIDFRPELAKLVDGS